MPLTSRTVRAGLAVAWALMLAALGSARADRLVFKTETAVSFVNPTTLNAEYDATNAAIGGTHAGYALPEVKNLLNQALYAGYEPHPRFDLGVLFTFPLISTVRTEGSNPAAGEISTEV